MILRRIIAILACIAFGVTAYLQANQFAAWQRLLLMTAGLLYLIKFVVVLLSCEREQLVTFSRVGLLIYMTIWPGMDLEPFRRRAEVKEDGARFVRGFLCMALGAAILLATILAKSLLVPNVVGWLGIIAMLTMVHFGYSEILTTLIRLSGFNVAPLFESPLLSTSLHDFWSVRWNRAFVEMNKVLFLPTIKKGLCAVNKKVAGAASLFIVFLVSGLLHELAISYPADKSTWGFPTIYFAIQGVGFLAERKLMSNVKSRFLRALWTWCWILIPLPLLFTDAFRNTLVVPMVSCLHSLVTQHDLRWWFSTALWCAAVGNFVTICAGSQVPFRLNWKEELARLSSFNRKIFLNYYGYIGLSIVSWGTLTILLHEELLAGDRAALMLAFLIGTFWGIRVLVDFLFFSHKDWPPGPEMVIGHTCLTALFCALTSTYFSLIIWHLMMK